MTTTSETVLTTSAPNQAVLDVEDLSIEFQIRSHLLQPKRSVRAVQQASIRIGAGETLGLVGESGSGKSSLGRGVCRLIPVAGGTVKLDGTDVTALQGRPLRQFRRHMQMVFQDPYSSLDPSSPVGDSIAEPLIVHEKLKGTALERRVAELLDRVGLNPAFAARYPSEFSGGQRQRLAIARAIALRPRFIVCDEAVSALDVSTQNQVINLLEDLQAAEGMAYLFISHDLSVVRHIADTVAVMYLGRIVEYGPIERVYAQPAHPYTMALLSASPIADPAQQRTREIVVLHGDLPDPANPPTGCPFSSRCPIVEPQCYDSMPPATAVAGGGVVRCHLAPRSAEAVSVELGPSN